MNTTIQQAVETIKQMADDLSATHTSHGQWVDEEARAEYNRLVYLADDLRNLQINVGDHASQPVPAFDLIKHLDRAAQQSEGGSHA